MVVLVLKMDLREKSLHIIDTYTCAPLGSLLMSLFVIALSLKDLKKALDDKKACTCSI
jgi:hypothetical protein